MKNLYLILASVFIYQIQGTSPQDTTQALNTLGENAYYHRVNTFIQKTKCEPILSEGNKYGIICIDKDGDLIYRKDDIDRD